MGYNKPKETTRNYLENAPLPNHGKSYTVISHKQVIDNTKQLLADSGFIIQKELYRANMDANVAQGIYHILPINTVDPTIMEEKELGMMFAWTNSYDKSTRFQCAIGAYVMVCHNGMVAGDMMNFRRKHTGSADHDIRMQISNQIKNGEKYYKRILNDRDAMRNTNLSLQEQAEIAGRLYINEDILDAAQMSCVKAELEKPSYDYQCDQENAWTFYNHVTHALKKAHPRDWLSDSQNFHDFMTARVLSKMNITMNDDLDLSEFDTTQDAGLNITMEEWNENAIQIDEDVTHSRLVQDIYLVKD
jgi:hypothetical protein